MAQYEDYRKLFSSALSLYQIFFANEGDPNDNMEKYREQVSKEILTAVLGEKERKELHERISGSWEEKSGIQLTKGVRDAFGTLLFSNYYQNALLDYKNNIPERVLQGQTRCALHLTTMAINPYSKDAFLNAKPFTVDDPWNEQLYHAFYYDQEDPPEQEEFTPKETTEELQYICRALLQQDPDSTNAGKPAWCKIGTVLEMADKVGIAYFTILGFATQLRYNQAYKVKVDRYPMLEQRFQLSRKLSQLFEKLEDQTQAFHTEKASLEQLISKLQERIKKFKNPVETLKKLDHAKQELTTLTTTSTRSRSARKGHVTRARRQFTAVSDELLNIEVRYLNYYKKARFINNKLSANRYVNRMMLGLSLFNLVNAHNNIVGEQSLKNQIALASAAVELASIVLSQFSRWDAKIGAKVAEKLFKKSAARLVASGGLKLSVQVGWVAGGIGVVLSIMDAHDSFKEGDTKTAAAYAISAAAGAISVGAGMAVYLTTSTVAGPIGIAAALISLAAVGIAVWLTKDDIETFLFATVFSKNNKLPHDLDTVQTVRNYLYNNRENLCRIYKRPTYNTGKSEINMGDFSNMLEWIYNLLTNFSMEVKYDPDAFKLIRLNATTGHGSRRSRRGVNVYYTPSLEVTFRFGYARPYRTNFEYFMSIFPYLPEDQNYYGVLDVQEREGISVPILQDENGIYTVNLKFDWSDEISEWIKEHDLGVGMGFLLGCRINIDEENKEFWPYTSGDKPHYIAYCGPLAVNGEAGEAYRGYVHSILNNKAKQPIFGTEDQLIATVLK